jgi:Cdc6-like AAA superfamily ATPase
MDGNTKKTLRAKAATVFRPGAPIDKLELFSGREFQVTQVVSATVQLGRHVIMFGERGVGKTSLAKVLVDFLDNADVYMLDSGTINCDSSDEFSSLWHKAFRGLFVVMEKKQVGYIKGKDQLENIDEWLPKKVKPDDVCHALSRLNQPSIIILDELDTLTDKETKKLLAYTIKNLSDHLTNSTLILVGVADTVDELISEHKSIQRVLVQVRLPRMTAVELAEVIQGCLDQVGMTINYEAEQIIISLSFGLPYYTHALGLYSATNAIDGGRTEITLDDVVNATHMTISTTYDLFDKYRQAVSSSQKKSLFAQVLLACALAPVDKFGYFTAAAVREPMSSVMRKPYDIPSYSRHLLNFCKENKGPVLERIGEDYRRQFRFADPLMQPFIILYNISQGSLDIRSFIKG